MMSDEHSMEQGRYAYEGLDRILHEKARLSILTCLATHSDGVLFNDLKELCSLTDGNLSRHLQVLEGAGLVEIWKGFHNRRPQTLCRMSEAGLKRFQQYLAELEKILEDAAAMGKEAKKKGSRAQRNDREGFAPA
jgi:DNA-binding transcriptional ArsR family regulator